MKAIRFCACLALVSGLAVPVQAQFRGQNPVRQQPQSNLQPLQNRVQQLPVQTQGNYQVQGNLIYNRAPTWVGSDTVNGQLMQPNLTNPYMQNYPMMNPYAPQVSPFTPMVNPYAQGMINPMLNPYQVNPYQLQSPFGGFTPAQQMLLQQNPYVPYNQFQAVNTMVPNNFAPVVGIGGNGFAGGR